MALTRHEVMPLAKPRRMQRRPWNDIFCFFASWRLCEESGILTPAIERQWRAQEENNMAEEGPFQDIEVEAYSGYRANERPVALLLAEKRVVVQRVLQRWITPEWDEYQVLGEDGRVYRIGWHRQEDWWVSRGVSYSVV